MKVIKPIFAGLLFVVEWLSLATFLFWCGVWGAMAHPETIPFGLKELETIVPISMVTWILVGIVKHLFAQKTMETIR